MITEIFTIYDDATKIFMSPFFSHTANSAIRSIVTQLKDPNSMLAQNPGDFTLYSLGTYDDHSGLVVPSTPPFRIGILTDYLELSIAGTPRSALPHPEESTLRGVLSDKNDAHREQPNLHGNGS